MRKAYITDIIAALFILLFVYAAASKLINYHTFKVQLGQSPIFASIPGPVALAVPAIEIMISILLCLTKWRIAGFYASFSLMTMFTTYIIAITKFSTYIPCSCGGILQKMTWNQHLIFNIVFLLLATFGILLPPQNTNLTREGQRPVLH